MGVCLHVLNWEKANRNNVATEKRSQHFFFSTFFKISKFFIIPIFDDNSKNVYLRFFSLFFPYYTAHYQSSMKTGSKLRGGLHIISWEKLGRPWVKPNHWTTIIINVSKSMDTFIPYLFTIPDWDGNFLLAMI